MFLLGGEVIVVLGPELVIAYLFDLSIYLDVVAVSLAMAAAARVKSAWHAARTRLSAVVSRLRQGPRNRRARRTPRVRRASPPDNDDDDPSVHRGLAA